MPKNQYPLIAVRCSEGQKKAIKKAAARDARSMSAWLLKLGLDEIERLGISIEDPPPTVPQNGRKKQKKQK